MKRLILSLLVLILVSLSLAGCTFPRIIIVDEPQPTVTETPQTSPIQPDYNPPPLVTDTAPGLYPDFASLIARARPSVVAITTTVSVMNIFGGVFTREGAGSGWIIDRSGLIVTNYHVVQNAERISITLEDGRNYLAETVRADPVTDLAILKIEATNLPPALEVGDSGALRVGNWVIAIGNSLGQGISATKGIVSALGVSITTDQNETLYDLIQTDAAINPGNSGGPLLNMAGQVIGINSVKVAQVGVEGMGYAISTRVAIPIINELIITGYVKRPWLGVNLYTVDQTAVRQLRLAVNRGVLITYIAPGSPADQAGLRQYDVITALDGRDYATVDDLVKAIRTYNIGDTVPLIYWRGNQQYTVSITFAQSPPPTP